MKKQKFFLLVLLLSLLIWAFNFNLVHAQNTQLAKWTFIVFLNGDNDLDPFGVKDINEMKKIGSSDQVNIIVLHDRFNKPARKLKINKNSVSVLEEVGEIDMGDYKELVKFVKWVKDRYPAQNYFLDIWNHGAGWKKRAQVFKGISYDEQSNNHISTPQLGEALKQIKNILGKKLDVLGMDACLMQMLEVAYEVKDYVSYIVASEETEPGDGWPYDLLLEPLIKNPQIKPVQLASIVAQTYHQYYSKTPENATQSVIDCTKLDELCAKVENLAKILMSKLNNPTIKSALKKAANEVQVYAFEDNCDLGHLCQLINMYVKDDEINKACDELLFILLNSAKKVIIKNYTTGTNVKNSTGLAIYLPKNTVLATYKNIKFGNTLWADFINMFTNQ